MEVFFNIWIHIWEYTRTCSREVSEMLSLLFSGSVVSKSLPPQGLQHARLPCPSPSPGACSDSCPLSQWWHSTISSSVIPFFSRLQFSPASGSFLEGLRQFRARFWGERREGNLKSLDSYFMRELNCNEALWSPNMSQFHRQITGLEGWCSAPLASPVHDWNPRSFSSELNLHLAVRTILFSWQTLEAFV